MKKKRCWKIIIFVSAFYEKERKNFGAKSVLLGQRSQSKYVVSKEGHFHSRFFPAKETRIYSDEIKCKNEAEMFVWEPWLKPPEFGRVFFGAMRTPRRACVHFIGFAYLYAKNVG